MKCSGIIGSGLCIYSRYSILAVYSHEFNVTGGIKDIADGEVFAGKGVLACLIRTPSGHVTVFNTHVSKEYHYILLTCNNILG